MKKLLGILLVGLNSFSSFAQEREATQLPQDHLTCNNDVLYLDYCKKNNLDPRNNAYYNNFEKELNERIAKFKTNKSERSGPTFIIPVVFHIVHVGGVDNISDAQIHDEINVLNRDFRKLNSDTASVIPAFKSIVADCEIEFRLAQKDAFGNCVSGITRTFSSKTYDGNQAMVNDVNMNLNGSSDINNYLFPNNMYLNVWICIDPNGAAGYTNGPVYGAIFPNYDGIWIRHDYIGSIGTSSVSHSRCLTHEIGHWLSLSHTWGSTNNPGCDGTILSAPCSGADNCTTDDGVTDTPNTIGWTSCNLAGSSCGSTVDNVQNYMEYSYCSNMFTEGQKVKMHTLLGLTVAGRNNLYTPTNLALTGVDGSPILCAANFTAKPLFVCAGDSINYTDNSYHGAIGWNWVHTGGTPITSTVQNPTITYNVPGTYDVALIANDGTSSVNTVKTNYIRVLDPVGASVPFSEGFETATSLPNADWMITDPDGEQQWQVINGIGSTGAKCMWLDNFTFNESSAKDALISKTYDLSGAGNAQIHFKYAYRQRTTADVEKLRVYISSDCGNTWSQKKLVSGSALSGSSTSTTAFVPTASDWMSFDVINITATSLTQGFIFKIEFESDKGNNIYIDDINLDINVGLDKYNFSPIEFNVYPNPVINQATIQYTLGSDQNITLSLKDVLGKEIAVLEKGNRNIGQHTFQLNETQMPVKGIYFVCLSNGVSNFTQKIVIE